MNELLLAIRDAPLAYLPEASLSLLFLFRRAYSARHKMHGRPHRWGEKMNRFGPWVRRRFQMPPSAIELSEPVILCFSDDERDAFYKYFELLEEFNSLDLEKLEPSPESLRRVQESQSPLQAFAHMIRSDTDHLWSHSDLLPAIGSRETQPQTVKTLIDIIRPNPETKLPGNHLEVRTFRGFCAYIMGDQRAYEDLELSPDEQRMGFRNFQRWIENEKSLGLPRPWHKIILYNSQFRDCNTCKNSAFSLFCDWLDEYATGIGKPELFKKQQSEGSTSLGNPCAKA
jgi:hypothetical protein